MNEEKKLTDSDWIRAQRLEDDRRRWLWTRIKSLVGWIGGALTFLWAGIDAFQKLVEWVTRK